MRPPVKRDKIANELRARILGGILPPGGRIPAEQELAHQWNVARDTLRDALRILEEEGLIERLPGKGTFVRARTEKEPGNVVTFLLPCADILADRIGYRTSLITREMLCGAMMEGGKQKLRIETVAVSPTNRNDDIDWHALSHLEASAKVIVFTLWYRPLFSFLAERKCRVALITTGSENRRAAQSGLTGTRTSPPSCGRRMLSSARNMNADAPVQSCRTTRGKCRKGSICFRTRPVPSSCFSRRRNTTGNTGNR